MSLRPVAAGGAGAAQAAAAVAQRRRVAAGAHRARVKLLLLLQLGGKVVLQFLAVGGASVSTVATQSRAQLLARNVRQQQPPGMGRSVRRLAESRPKKIETGRALWLAKMVSANRSECN